MSVALKLTVLFAILVQAACGGHRLNAPAPVSLNLLPPSEISAAVLLKQKITLQADAQPQQQFLAVSRFDCHRLKLVILSPSGQRLLSLDYDGDKLTQESYAQIELPGREILAIIQFATWPEDSIRTHYPERDGWIVETAVNQRILLTASGTVLKISYQPEVLSVENYLQGYRVIVTTLEKTRL
jgi:hypothetical protein